ncbi:hypothetical protein QUW13_00115 [Enterococcus hirae]|nr:hypothetical protein [Enterococcus hirae]
MQQNTAYYLRTINELVQTTEKTGDTMNPFYKEARSALDEKTTLSAEKLAEIKEHFAQGVVDYQAVMKKIRELRPPAKVMGNHQKLVKVYQEYLAGCEEMLTAIDPEKGIDSAAFNASETKQDAASEQLGKVISRITRLFVR